MADTTILQLNKLTTGSHSGTWGDLTNDNMSKIDTSIKGYTAVAVASTTQTLTTGSAGTGNQINTASFKFTGTLSGNSNIVCPAQPTWYFVDDATSRTGNNWTLTFKPSGGTGVLLVNNAKHVLYTDGSTMFDVGADMGNILANGTLTANNAVSFDPVNATAASTAFTFNNSEGDYDARFAGDSETNLLFIDASTDRVGIKTDSPADDFHVAGTVKVTGASDFDGAGFVWNDSAASLDFRLESGGSNPQPNMFIVDGSADKIGIGTATPADARLEINQKESAGAIACLALDQDDEDKQFIYFDGTTATDSSTNVSTSADSGGTKNGAILVNVNGIGACWIRVYDSAV
jgi:hypothetical protein